MRQTHVHGDSYVETATSLKNCDLIKTRTIEGETSEGYALKSILLLLMYIFQSLAFEVPCSLGERSGDFKTSLKATSSVL